MKKLIEAIILEILCIICLIMSIFLNYSLVFISLDIGAILLQGVNVYLEYRNIIKTKTNRRKDNGI